MKNIAIRKIWLLITTAYTTHVTPKKANSMSICSNVKKVNLKSKVFDIN